PGLDHGLVRPPGLARHHALARASRRGRARRDARPGGGRDRRGGRGDRGSRDLSAIDARGHRARTPRSTLDGTSALSRDPVRTPHTNELKRSETRSGVVAGFFVQYVWLVPLLPLLGGLIGGFGATRFRFNAALPLAIGI